MYTNHKQREGLHNDLYKGQKTVQWNYIVGIAKTYCTT